MSKPPYGQVAGIAKHGSDEDLLAHRDDIRWLGRWTDEIHNQLQMIWRAAEVLISSEHFDEECNLEVRDVTIRLKLTTQEINTLTMLLQEGE